MKNSRSINMTDYAQEFTEMTEVAKTMIPLMRDMDGNILYFITVAFLLGYYNYRTHLKNRLI